MDENNDHENQGETLEWYQSPTFKIAALVCILTVLCTLVFLGGGWYSCKSGGGFYSSMKCHDIEVIGTCEDISGNKYIVPKNYILPNGTIPTVNYDENK